VKILIIRFSSIGDIILTSPAVRYAKNELQAEVHYLTRLKYQELVNSDPNIDKVFLYDNNFSVLARILRKEKYDLIADLHKNILSFAFRTALNRKSHTLQKWNISKWLMVNFKKKIEVPHIVTRYLETTDKDYQAGFNDSTEIFFTEGTVLPSEIEHTAPYYCFSLGAMHNTKKIPADLAARIIQNVDYPVVLIGGYDVISEADDIKDKLGDMVINLCGKLSLSESAMVIKNCKTVVSADTGMMHMASALGKEVHAIWGSTVPEFGMTAYYGTNNSKSINYEIELACRPCSKIGFEKCPKKHFNCMKQQDHLKIASNIRRSMEIVKIV
jgi:ADP-heptose:LPS heptosyltransferase